MQKREKTFEIAKNNKRIINKKYNLSVIWKLEEIQETSQNRVKV